MIAGKYTLKDFFVNRYLKQVIIPEIQRDYLWPEKPLFGLLHSLLDAFKEFHAFIPTLQLADQELAASFTAYQRRLAHSANIGFIYAYSDEEYAGRYFLIDGQQRITSLFLMLLALAHRNAGLKDQFKRVFYADFQNKNSLKLDYKVREAAHDFLFKFVPYLLSADAEEVDEQPWRYTAANPDVTIQTLLANFRLLQKEFASMEFTGFDSKAAGEEKLFEYLTEYTEFYYFDTNLSEQGEELYIYMNARGEKMQPNENLKAELLGALTSNKKEDWGTKWEQWQDFFWQHRAAGGADNPNADDGFNEFLACIKGLTNQLKSATPDDPEAPLKNIEQYVDCLQRLSRDKQAFKNRYTCSDWVDKCWNEIWGILNKEKNDWDKDHRRRALIWPVLHFMTQHPNLASSPADAFRVLRMHYLRYHNHSASVDKLKAETNERLGPAGVFRTNGPEREENLKHDLYAAVGPDQLEAYEQLIWAIEDHPFNLDGSDGGLTNLTHLVDITPTPPLDDLKKVRDKFYELLPPDKPKFPALQNVLLCYGPYQHRKPSYYSNYNFGDWKRTIRGRGSEEISAEKENVFRRFFRDFVREDVSLDAFLRMKFVPPLHKDDALAFHQKVLWYAQSLGNDTWNRGTYIACKDWEDDDDNFAGFPIIYNTNSDMRSSYSKLQDMRPKTAIE